MHFESHTRQCNKQKLPYIQVNRNMAHTHHHQQKQNQTNPNYNSSVCDDSIIVAIVFHLFKRRCDRKKHVYQNVKNIFSAFFSFFFLERNGSKGAYTICIKIYVSIKLICKIILLQFCFMAVMEDDIEIFFKSFSGRHI